MAKMRGIVGSISGRSGNQVFCKGSNGSTIMRVYQPQVSNPRTDRQVRARDRFARAAKLTAGFAFGLSLSNLKRKDFAANLLSSESPKVQVGNDGEVEVNWSKIVVSTGSLPNSNFKTPTTSNLTISSVVTASDAAVARLSDGELLGAVLVAYQPDLDQSVLGSAVIAVKGNSTTPTSPNVGVVVPELWGGTDVHLYAFTKIIPAASEALGMESGALNWKYPAPTSGTVYLGKISAE